MATIGIGAAKRATAELAATRRAGSRLRKPENPSNGNPDRASLGGGQELPYEKWLLQESGARGSKLAKDLTKSEAAAALPNLQNGQEELDAEIKALQTRKADAKLASNDAEVLKHKTSLDSLYEKKAQLSKIKNTVEKRSIGTLGKVEKVLANNQGTIMVVSSILPALMANL